MGCSFPVRLQAKKTFIEEAVNAKYNSYNCLIGIPVGAGAVNPAGMPIGRCEGEAIMGEWTLFSNHGHVLVCLANNNQARLRDVAGEVGITERAVQNILRELQASGLVQVSKHGRCNHYQINTRKSLRHPLEAHCTVGKLLQMLKSETTESAEPATAGAVKMAAGSSPQAAVEVAKPVVLVAHKPAVKAAKPRPAEPAAVAAVDANLKPVKQQVAAEPVTEAKTGKPETKKSETPGAQQGSLF